jgi:tetratricopeptide (TPR) repeat protein
MPGAMMRKVPAHIGLAILTSSLVLVSAVRADSFSACSRANTAFEKVDLCSVVILHSRQAQQLERAYLRRGNAYLELSRFADAVNDFDSLIRIDPKIAGYYDNRQRALKSLGRFGEALNDANMTIRLAPTYSFGYRSRGNVSDAMGRYDDAIADYTKAISIEPRDVGVLIDRGKTFSKTGRDREAVADFSHAIDIDGNAMVAFRERGLVYKKLGDFAASMADLSWFTRSAPTDQEVVSAIEEMQSARLGTATDEPKATKEVAPPAAETAPGLAMGGTARADEACHHVLNQDPVFIGNWEWLYIPTENRAELAVEDCPGDNAVYLACKPGKSEYWIEFDHHKGPAVPRHELTLAIDTGRTLHLGGTSTMTTPEGHSFETGGFTSDPLS